MKSSNPLSFSVFDYLKRFDSGLRHLVKVRETLNLQRFSYFSVSATLQYILIMGFRSDISNNLIVE